MQATDSKSETNEVKVSFVITSRADYLVIYEPMILGAEAIKVKLINDRANEYHPIIVDDDFTMSLIKIRPKGHEGVYRETVDDIID